MLTTVQRLREEWLNLICTEWMQEQLDAGPWGDGNSSCSCGHQLICPLLVPEASVCLNLSVNQVTIFCYETLLSKAPGS